jgi:hypothetical protein
MALHCIKKWGGSLTRGPLAQSLWCGINTPESLEDYKFYLYIPIEQLSSSSEQWFWIMLDFLDDDPKPLNLTSDWGSICH